MATKEYGKLYPISLNYVNSKIHLNVVISIISSILFSSGYLKIHLLIKN